MSIVPFPLMKTRPVAPGDKVKDKAGREGFVLETRLRTGGEHHLCTFNGLRMWMTAQQIERAP